tara:strand:+ start:1221 stop:2627 length:1407 start_codon:yes stop_codon:yes gene_type:complete
MMDIKNILILILITLVFPTSKQVYATIQMLDQVMVLDTETLQIDQNINTEFNQEVQCPDVSNQADCISSDNCDWMMGVCIESMTSNTVNTPHFIVLDEVNGYWFVTTIASGFIAQYSLLDNSFIDSYFVGDAPALLAIDPNNKIIYCSRMMPMNGMNDMMLTAESNIIQALNYSSMGLSQSLNQEYIIDSPAPHGLAINNEGTEIYTASNTADWLYKINTQTNEITGVVMDEIINNTPDLTTQRLKPIQCISSGNRLFVSCSAGTWMDSFSGQSTIIEGKLQMWDSDLMELVDSIDLGEHSSPWHIIKSPVDEIIYVVLGGDNLYETEGLASVSYQNDILSVNWITNNSSFDTLHGIDVSSDGQIIYVSGRGDGNIHIFNSSGNYIDNIFLGQMSMLGGIAVEKKGLPVLGDINNDFNFNISDIIGLVNTVLSPMMSHPYQAYASDLNQDELINIFDVILLVESVLSN